MLLFLVCTLSMLYQEPIEQCRQGSSYSYVYLNSQVNGVLIQTKIEQDRDSKTTSSPVVTHTGSICV